MEDLEKKFNRTSKFFHLLNFREKYLYRKIRERIWTGISGTVLDAGVGTGCNLPFYPKNTKVTGIDISEGMLQKARYRAQKTGIHVEFRKENVYNLSFQDNTFDYIIATMLCCCISDSDLAIQELKRVCKKKGRLIFLDYIPSQKLGYRWIQKLVTPYTRFMFGLDFTQDTRQSLWNNGCTILREENQGSDILKLIVAEP